MYDLLNGRKKLEVREDGRKRVQVRRLGRRAVSCCSKDGSRATCTSIGQQPERHAHLHLAESQQSAPCLLST